MKVLPNFHYKPVDFRLARMTTLNVPVSSWRRKKIVSPISTLVLNTFVDTQIKFIFYDLLLKMIDGDPATVMIVFQPEFYGGKNENDKVYSVARERKVGRYVRIFPHGFKLDRTGRLCMKVEIYGNPYLREYCTCLSLLNTLCVSKICYSSPLLKLFY